MSTTISEIRRGAYYDSVVLMQLQASLKALPGIINAGVMMGTDNNKELLRQNNLLTPEAESVEVEDLIISVTGADEKKIRSALDQVDQLLSERKSNLEQEYLPKSLEAAVKMMPDAKWVLVSVPGQYAIDIAAEALRLQKNVFLYSDNVSTEKEKSLKKEAIQNGLLVMGPDCGTSIINGIGFGFANQVRKGPIGLVGASGTGLQQVSSRIHQLGSGITHAIGTGGRDLSEEIGGITSQQGLDLLNRDPETEVIILISKPPSSTVTSRLLRAAASFKKPVVVNFIGYTPPPAGKMGANIYFASSLGEAAELAVKLADSELTLTPFVQSVPEGLESKQLYLRGLFSGGTLAYEAMLILQNYLPGIHSNIPLDQKYKLTDAHISQGHTIVDLGEDEFTKGRPHPMIDNTLRIERLIKEAEDPTVAIIFMDIVLGFGAHPDPASEFVPVISAALNTAKQDGRKLEIVVTIIGTDDDPQDLNFQIEEFKEAGAKVETNINTAISYIGQRLQALNSLDNLTEVDLSILQQPVKAINIGLESFAESLNDQNASVIHVDWRPPAGGNEELMAILQRMKSI